MTDIDAVDEFFSSLNGADLARLESVLHPDFEMVVPQKPARGFKGRDQELKNMQYLFDTYPDFAVTVLRKAVQGFEVWTETTASASGMEVAAVVIWTLDESRRHILSGRYYSERVDRSSPTIEEFMSDLGSAGQGAAPPSA